MVPFCASFVFTSLSSLVKPEQDKPIMKAALLLTGLAGLASALPAADTSPPPAPLAARVPVPAADADPATLEDRALKVSVNLPYANIIGKDLFSVQTFNAIPYAEPPVGKLRLRPPKRLERDIGDVDARGIAPACPQMYLTTENDNPFLDFIGDALTLPIFKAVNGQEDCLTVNVQRPSGTKEGDKLPVLFWIFGGGFQLGSTGMYDASGLLKAGVNMKQPFIFVSVNYRVGGFGFLPGKEVLADGAANLGLLDQRMGLEWVADNIGAFGGDPEKVTIWGESAGAISVMDQMVLYGGNITYKGKDLFRGAIMNSGSVIPAEKVDCAKGQAVYDNVVKMAGCGGAKDTLECLREADYKKLLQATNSAPGIFSYNSVALSYLPRPDGVVLTSTPDQLVMRGEYASVPFIIGDQEDEGTLFALFQSNLTTTDKVVDYLSDIFFPQAGKKVLKGLVETYPSRAKYGSPFRTSVFNEIYPGFKRLAALLGDIVFTLTRRVFLEMTSEVKPDVPSWVGSGVALMPPLISTNKEIVIPVILQLWDPGNGNIPRQRPNPSVSATLIPTNILSRH